MTRMRWIGLGCLWSLFFVVLIGCDGGKAQVTEQNAESTEETPDESVQANASADSSETAPKANPSSLVHKRGGKDWIGEVPLDVWFDDPLAVASTMGEVAPAKTSD